MHLLGVGKVIGLMRDIDSMGKGIPGLQTGTTQYHAQLALPDKRRAIKGLFDCNEWDLEPGPRLLSTVP